MIQAKSLAGVVDLADNPPTSPNFNVNTFDPLVLYIARVPGSRDVFLTTARPLQKVVTAQDIQGSLYYVHVDSHDDERLRASFDDNCFDIIETERSTDYGHSSNNDQNHLAPVVALNGSETSGNDQPAMLRNSTERFNISPAVLKKTPIVRKPVGQRTQSEVVIRSVPPSSKARIIGPRAMGAPLQASNIFAPALAHGKENVIPHRQTEKAAPVLPLSPSNPLFPCDVPHRNHQLNPSMNKGEEPHEPYLPTPRQKHQLSHELPKYHHDLGDEALSLTLIRRYDGSQKNAGRISSVSDYRDSRDVHPTKGNLSLEINTPGYTTFQDPKHFEGPPADNQAFQRDLEIVQGASQGVKSRENDYPSAIGKRTSRMSIDFRRLSVQGSTDSATSPRHSREGKLAQARNYRFSSPWDGICEFETSITGQALKCKHTLPTQGSQTSIVSELRFNLPTSKNVDGTSSGVLRSPERPRDPKRPSYFSKRHRSEPFTSAGGNERRSTEEDDMVDPSVLSLGQERAGGGFGGKKAKLGKLIIEPEGLKMLDLLVAANMGLWWKAYESYYLVSLWWPRFLTLISILQRAQSWISLYKAKMRVFQPRWMALSAIVIPLLLIPQLVSPIPEKRIIDLPHEDPKPSTAFNLNKLQDLLHRITPRFLNLEPRAPVETPPTAYLPYPPPPNYSWPPGPHTQYPPPSETNAPGGWYGGTGTGGQGNSGAGSAQGSNPGSGATSAGVPSLRVPSLIPFIPFETLFYLLPSSLLPASSPRRRHGGKARRVLQARDPLETPPTQFLPYPPPPNYQWPEGQGPGDQNPQPSEFDPPPGVYGGYNPNSNAGSPSSSSSSNPGTQPLGSNGGGGGGKPSYGPGHLAWIIAVTIIGSAIVFGLVGYWYKGKKMAK
ncbi:MAG: hypothetical protein Q9174_005645, partial [Haloplaca sp. 1 TL-2023]